MAAKREPSQTPSDQGDNPATSETRAGGFGKPPTHAQFRKGKSGNPRGRPVKVRTLQESARWALRQKVRVTEGGTPSSLSIQEVILRKFAKDPGKARFLFELAYRDVQFRPRSPELDELIRIKKAYQARLDYNAQPRSPEELEELARRFAESRKDRPWNNRGI